MVLVINRFHHFCAQATPQLVNTLRGLRDQFKDTLIYIAGMPQEVAYLSQADRLGNMYEWVDNYSCWVGSMGQADQRQLIREEIQTTADPPGETEVTAMLELGGGFPALLKTLCHWWMTTPPIARGLAGHPAGPTQC